MTLTLPSVLSLYPICLFFNPNATSLCPLPLAHVRYPCLPRPLPLSLPVTLSTLISLFLIPTSLPLLFTLYTLILYSSVRSFYFIVPHLSVSTLYPFLLNHLPLPCPTCIHTTFSFLFSPYALYLVFRHYLLPPLPTPFNPSPPPPLTSLLRSLPFPSPHPWEAAG